MLWRLGSSIARPDQFLSLGLAFLDLLFSLLWEGCLEKSGSSTPFPNVPFLQQWPQMQGNSWRKDEKTTFSTGLGRGVSITFARTDRKTEQETERGNPIESR